MSTHGNHSNLPLKQQKAIAALLSAKDILSAAQQAGLATSIMSTDHTVKITNADDLSHCDRPSRGR